MKIDFESGCIPAATLVSNDFIDRLMPSANGEYVKVFLYLLRHAGEDVSASSIADALELTEGDVRRALSRWQREGLLSPRQDTPPSETGTAEAAETAHVQDTVSRMSAETAPVLEAVPAGKAVPVRERAPFSETGTAGAAETAYAQATGGLSSGNGMPAEEDAPSSEGAEMPELRSLPPKSEVDFKKLRSDSEFTTLLYIVQRYLSKIFSQTDSETIAYLYDVLRMPAELLTYLAELCAQRGKTSLRYYESIALDWYRRGIVTVGQAKAAGERYSTEVYAVMKAFGLNGRNPGTEELRYMRKWFDEQGFSKEVVLEACSRTLIRIQKPSFPYADRILTEWHDAGVRTLAEAQKYEADHAGRRNRTAAGSIPAKSGTKFSNFHQRDDDIDAFALELMKRQMKQG